MPETELREVVGVGLGVGDGFSVLGPAQFPTSAAAPASTQINFFVIMGSCCFRLVTGSKAFV